MFLWYYLQKPPISKEISILKYEVSSIHQDNKLQEVVVGCSPRIFNSRFL